MLATIRLPQKLRDEVDRARESAARADQHFKRVVADAREAVHAPNHYVYDADTAQFIDPASLRAPPEVPKK